MTEISNDGVTSARFLRARELLLIYCVMALAAAVIFSFVAATQAIGRWTGHDLSDLSETAVTLADAGFSIALFAVWSLMVATLINCRKAWTLIDFVGGQVEGAVFTFLGANVGVALAARLFGYTEASPISRILWISGMAVILALALRTIRQDLVGMPWLRKAIAISAFVFFVTAIMGFERPPFLWLEQALGQLRSF